MHEMGLMAEMVDLLAESAKEHQVRRIDKVKLIVGKMTNALPDALQMAFDVYKEQELFSPSAVLEIEERETIGHCAECGTTFPVRDNALFICPSCQGLRIDIVSGRELYIENYEGEEETRYDN
ncbi:Hydrogenase nickel incorporation protein HypA/HybF [Acididesulfobacillus acetoxydans]|uniref:Hydrogenase maturation factor HypA n=1 Tax=Acididesulfobacillus acetoxydans TaxID=1561005 RepID=A0A8S0XBU6_9FIRM|nr:hydrogenase maturation nickel metallochaperone HypA [Acididesulfobacillus acetoxydans]CAA7601646.1 Hydrogenase nickel incorporation protein HypA/HybF [Acididesulfobacillus acetoxydans]CEJ07133.1 Hydrogenase expression/synthesis hypA family [Acididesulfobacillus acetoxydans]